MLLPSRRTRQTRAKAAADAAPLAGDGRGSWWACCVSKLLGRSTSTTSCLLPAGRWRHSRVRAGPEGVAPVAGSKWTHLQAPPLGAARTPFLLRARGKPVEKLVPRFLGRRPVPVSGIQGALTAGQTLFWHPPPDLSAGRPLTRAPDVRRSYFLGALPDARRQGGGVFRARVGPALDADLRSPTPGECKSAPSHPAAHRVASRAHMRNAVLRRPAEAQGPRCARAGHHVSGRGSSLSL